MKIAVTLSILSLAVAALPAFACDNKDCEHSKGAKKSHTQQQQPVREASEPASKPAVEKNAEATGETKPEAK